MDALKNVTWKQVLDCKKEYEHDGSTADSVDVTGVGKHKLYTLDKTKKILTV